MQLPPIPPILAPREAEAPSNTASEASSVGDPEDDAILFSKALSLKEAGNDSLKLAKFEEAREHYAQGVKDLEKSIEKTSDDFVALHRALNLNLALACLKTEKFFEGVQAATKVLEKDPNNVKALLRRGKCAANYGDLDKAKADYMAVIRAEPTNKEARLELADVRRKIDEHNKNQRSALKGIFEKGQGLYADREAEMEKARKAHELKLAALKADWEKEMGGKPEAERVSFEDWKAEKDKMSEPSAKSSTTTSNAPPAKPTSGSPAGRTRTINPSNDDVDWDEEDLRVLAETKKKGYCYFRRELTEEEKRRREMEHVPAKVETTAASETGSPEAPSAVFRPKTVQGVSEWNAAGTTYEEKDMTAWCQSKLGKLLGALEWESMGWKSGLQSLVGNPSNLSRMMEALKNPEQEMASLTSSLYPFAIRVTGTPEVKGDAQIMVVRGSKRCYYEMSVKLNWEFEIRKADDVSAGQESPDKFAQIMASTMLQKGGKWKGTLHIDELSSLYRSGDEDIASVKANLVARIENPSSMNETERQIYSTAMDSLKESFVQAVKEFEAAYKEAY